MEKKKTLSVLEAKSGLIAELLSKESRQERGKVLRLFWSPKALFIRNWKEAETWGGVGLEPRGLKVTWSICFLLFQSSPKLQRVIPSEGFWWIEADCVSIMSCVSNISIWVRCREEALVHKLNNAFPVGPEFIWWLSLGLSGTNTHAIVRPPCMWAMPLSLNLGFPVC